MHDEHSAQPEASDDATRPWDKPKPGAEDATIDQPVSQPVGDLSGGGGVLSGAPHIAGYRMLGRLGEGGMGAVWKAEQIATRRTVALKVMSATTAGSDKARRRFEREVELAARIDHPHIAAVYDSGLDRQLYYYALEYVDGLPLDVHVQRQGLSDRAFLQIMVEVCRAVAAAHRLGVIHRDLKPSNILVTSAGTPKVLDFGLAKPTAPEADGMVSVEGEILGTPRYMSPEQADARHAAVDTRTDVYALGVITYQQLTGLFPHPIDEGESYLSLLRMIASQPPRRPRLARPDLDADTEAILLKALDPDPDQRYPGADDLADDIEDLLGGKPVGAQRATAGYLTRKWVGRHRLATGMILGLLFAALTLAGWAYNRPAELMLRSEPQGAAILVNGTALPDVMTDAWVTLPRGRHEILLVAEGRIAERRVIQVNWGRAVGEASDPINLRAAHQRVFFTSEPPNAQVVLEDPGTGRELRRLTTPDDPAVAYGSYHMRFELPGYADPQAGQTLSITGGDALRVHRDLRPVP